MESVNSEVWLGGGADLRRGRLYRMDDRDSLAGIPAGWRGGIDTDRIEIVGPALSERRTP